MLWAQVVLLAVEVISLLALLCWQGKERDEHTYGGWDVVFWILGFLLLLAAGAFGRIF